MTRTASLYLAGRRRAERARVGLAQQQSRGERAEGLEVSKKIRQKSNCLIALSPEQRNFLELVFKIHTHVDRGIIRFAA